MGRFPNARYDVGIIGIGHVGHQDEHYPALAAAQVAGRQVGAVPQSLSRLAHPLGQGRIGPGLAAEHSGDRGHRYPRRLGYVHDGRHKGPASLGNRLQKV